MLVDASAESGKTGMVGYNVATMPLPIRLPKQLMDETEFGEACQYHTRYLAPGPRLQEAGSPFAWALHARSGNPSDRLLCVFLWGRVSEVFATGTVDAASSTVSMSVNLRYENGGIGTMTLGTGPVLEAMVFVKGTGDQAIQVLETRRLRRYPYADMAWHRWRLC